VPSSVATLLSSVGLEPGGPVRWGEPIPETGSGVYLVSLTSSPDRVNGVLPHCPVSASALDALLEAWPHLRLDGEVRDRDALARRLASYWLPDECVLYTGLAGQPLRARVRQYYRTPLGAAKPHKGGWCVKTLCLLDELWVHYAATPDSEKAEAEMLRAFAAGVSDMTRRRLPARDPVLPFANLRDGHWRRKSHGLTGATAPPSGRRG
jgi:hypothetical protein